MSYIWCNVGQNIGDKVEKLNKVGFFVGCFGGFFFAVFKSNYHNSHFEWLAGHWPLIPSISSKIDSH